VQSFANPGANSHPAEFTLDCRAACVFLRGRVE